MYFELPSEQLLADAATNPEEVLFNENLLAKIRQSVEVSSVQ